MDPAESGGRGAFVGLTTAVVLTIVLLSFQGGEGDIASAPVWWTFIILTAVAVGVTGLLLIRSTVWRRFGVGFVIGAFVAIPVMAAVLFIFLLLTYDSGIGGG